MLEEMPPFPERESSLLAKLKQKKPTSVSGEKKSGAITKVGVIEVNNTTGESSTDEVAQVGLIKLFIIFYFLCLINCEMKPLRQRHVF